MRAARRPASTEPVLRRSRGQSVTEFALILPVAILILLLGIDFGRVYLGWVNLNNMARIGANFAALNPDAWEGAGDVALKAKYQQLMLNDASAYGCALPSPIPDPAFPDVSPNTYSLGSRAQVTITCQFQLFTPIVGSLIGNPLPVTATSVFPIRGGGVAGIAVGTALPTMGPSSSPSASPSASASASPSASASSDPSATAPPPPPVAAIYGTPSEAGYDAVQKIGPHSAGGGSGSSQVVVGWNWNVPIQWTNTSSGNYTACSWAFGAGSTPASSNSCSPSSTRYNQQGTYTVQLTVTGPGGSSTATFTVIAACQVPDFHNVKKNSATALWTGNGSAGFTTTPSFLVPPNGNYDINSQSLTSGQLNPQGGCGASITLGP